MKRDNKKALYESIMASVAKEVKKALNESYEEDGPVEHFEEIANDFAMDGECVGTILKVLKPVNIRGLFTDQVWSDYGTPVLKYFERYKNYYTLHLRANDQLVCIMRQGRTSGRMILYLTQYKDEWIQIYEDNLPEPFNDLFEIIKKRIF